MYGLDIETDTATGGLDPTCSAVVAVAVAGPLPGGGIVLDGDEPALLARLDTFLAELPPGVVVTWNGSGFDLPFLAYRAALHAIPLGLRTHPRSGGGRRLRAAWYGHDHLDAYLVYRNDVRRALQLSCGLKSIARFVGIPAIEVDAAAVHDLAPDVLHAYVLSDATAARELALRRWSTAAAFRDRLSDEDLAAAVRPSAHDTP